MAKKTTFQSKINIKNKRASFDFALFDDYTAGIVLTGTEIKSIRQGKASLVDTFCYVHNGEVRYYRPAAVQENAPYFNIDGLKSLPKVGIAYGYADAGRDVVDMMVRGGYNGIVYAGVGNGNIHMNVFPALENAVRNGVVVVRSSRVPTGATTLDAEVDDAKYHFVASWGLNPQKARILLMLALTKPKFFMPVHGEYMHLASHRDLAVSMGMDKNDVFVMKLGEVLELNKEEAKVNGTVPTGQIMVDGLGVGDVGNIVLRDRKHLSQDGLMVVVVSMDKEYGTIVSGPDIISRGFVYVREAESLIEEAKMVVEEALEDSLASLPDIDESDFLLSLFADIPLEDL